MTKGGPKEPRARADLDRMLARHLAVGSEPRQDVYGRLGIHPDRLRLRALPMEARVWAKSLLRHDAPKPFVIYGRPRSGTTLLVHLLDQIPGVRCDGELLHDLLLSPSGFLRRLPLRAGTGVRAYGVKVLSYQLMEVQRVHRPLAFFDRLGRNGYDVIHLTRNSWDQTLSLMKAQESGLYFTDKGTGARTLQLDPGRFLDLLRWNERMLDYERTVMSHLEHYKLCYDRDLKDPSRYQQTVDALCARLGVPSADVSVTMRRTSSGLAESASLPEHRQRIEDKGYRHL